MSISNSRSLRITVTDPLRMTYISSISATSDITISPYLNVVYSAILKIFTLTSLSKTVKNFRLLRMLSIIYISITLRRDFL